MEEIVKYPRFQQCVREHWNRFYPTQLEDIEEFIDAFVDQVSAAGDADALRWPEYLNGVPLKRRSDYFYKPLLRAKVNFLVEQWCDSIAE